MGRGCGDHTQGRAYRAPAQGAASPGAQALTLDGRGPILPLAGGLRADGQLHTEGLAAARAVVDRGVNGFTDGLHQAGHVLGGRRADVRAQEDWGPAHTAHTACRLPPHPFPLHLGGTERPEPAALMEPPCLSELFKFKLSLNSKSLVSRRMIRAAFNSDTLPRSSSTSAPFCGPLALLVTEGSRAACRGTPGTRSALLRGCWPGQRRACRAPPGTAQTAAGHGGDRRGSSRPCWVTWVLPCGGSLPAA